MKYEINWDLKTDKNALGLMQKRGGDLIKAMKAVGDSKGQGNQSSAIKKGVQQNRDKFSKDMIKSQMELEQYGQSEKNLGHGTDLLKNVKNMLNVLQQKIRASQTLWIGITEFGRDLQNEDLRKILDIRKNISIIFELCSQMRYKGTSVFGKTVNVQGGGFVSGNGRGHVIDFGTFYSDLRQNLIYIRENISSYTEKATISQKFTNSVQIIFKAIKYCGETTKLFNSVSSGVKWRKKAVISKRDSLIRERQSELTKEAIIGILRV